VEDEPEVQCEATLYEESLIKAKYHQMLESNRVDELDRTLFKELIKSLLKEDRSVKSLPSDQDLDWVFEVADADQSGMVDEDEFVALYKLASAGHVKGLG
jgi:Ca2+-binding EF-hand superfamily protein